MDKILTKEEIEIDNAIESHVEKLYPLSFQEGATNDLTYTRRSAFMAGSSFAKKLFKEKFASQFNEQAGLSEREQYLEKLINNPEIENFLEGVKLEAAHQTERWGKDHEEMKMPHDYALVLDKLKGKLAIDVWDLNLEKYKHHLITIAAVCFNAHRQIHKEGTNMNRFFGYPKDAPKYSESVELPTPPSI